MVKPIINAGENLSQWRTKINDLTNSVGNLANLAGGDSDVVLALNNIDSDIGDLSTLATNTNASIVEAINELNQRIIAVYDSDGTQLN